MASNLLSKAKKSTPAKTTTSKDKNLAHSKIKGTSIELPAEAVVTLVVRY